MQLGLGLLREGMLAHWAKPWLRVVSVQSLVRDSMMFMSEALVALGASPWLSLGMESFLMPHLYISLGKALSADLADMRASWIYVKVRGLFITVIVTDDCGC